MGFLSRLERLSRGVWIPSSQALLALSGYLDRLRGYELSFSLFYLLPIAWMTWMDGRCMGVAASLV